MWNEATIAIQNQLNPSETLLWSGQPQKGILFRSTDLLMVPFTLLWGGFACFWEGTALGNGAPFFFGLWGIPFVLVGAYMIAGRFVVDALRRDKSYYGVTNERIIILSGLLSRKVKSLNLRTLTDLSMDQKANGRGTITFGPTHPMSGFYSTMSWPGMNQPIAPCFEGIQEVNAVYNLIRDAQRQA